MNFLFHCWEFPPNGSGIGSYILQMSRALKAAGHRTIVLTSRCAGMPREEESDAGLILRAYEMDEIGSHGIVDMALAVAREHQIDVIEAVDHLGESAGVLRAKNRPPVMVKCHYNDVLHVARYAQVFYKWQRFTVDIACARNMRRILAEKFSVEHADILSAPSRRILDEMTKQGLRLPEKIGVLPNPIELPEGYVNREDPNPVVLFVGRLDIGKGIQYLPDLIAAVVKRRPDVRFELAGSDSYARCVGSTRDWLAGRIGALGKYARFLGHLTPRELDAAYSRAWVVIAPSRWDTFPTAVLESMARAKAIVASPNGGMPEMLADTLCRLSDPSRPDFADAVAGMLGDSRKRQLAGESARSKALAFYSHAVVAAQYVDFVKTRS